MVSEAVNLCVRSWRDRRPGGRRSWWKNEPAGAERDERLDIQSGPDTAACEQGIQSLRLLLKHQTLDLTDITGWSFLKNWLDFLCFFRNLEKLWFTEGFKWYILTTKSSVFKFVLLLFKPSKAYLILLQYCVDYCKSSAECFHLKYHKTASTHTDLNRRAQSW